ncbi:hypothetical protein LZ32DRAFT_117743 [Colletotrichum eremochloae]|nr:hypothetical protein LZ32DRAFT_117743 [Colletotrichum eremochloae]
MPCLEVCVYCFDRFTTVSKFRKHAQSHKGASSRKNTFMVGMSDDLRAQAILELDRLLDTKLPTRCLRTMSTKRELGTADLASETSQAFKKVKSVESTAITPVTAAGQGRSVYIVGANCSAVLFRRSGLVCPSAV